MYSRRDGPAASWNSSARSRPRRKGDEMATAKTAGLFERMTGIGSPLTSWTFWALVLILGGPAASGKTFGVELDANAITGLLDPDLPGGDRLGLLPASRG